MQKNTQKDVIVIGGGASGMMAALTAAGKGHQVLLLEKNERVGRKLAATGNGRGNISNGSLQPSCYGGAAPDFIWPALSAFGVEETRKFFASIGVIFHTESNGRIYPCSYQASSVVDCLRFALEKAGVEIHTCFVAEDIHREPAGFSIKGNGKKFFCRKLIMAAGGQAAPALGGCTDGYRLLEKLGHHSSPRFPALVQLKTDNTYPKALKGLKIEGKAVLYVDGQEADSACGDILFAEYGLSGNAVFAVSARAVQAQAAAKTTEIGIDMLPDIEAKELYELLLQRRQDCGHLILERFFAGLLHNKLGIMVCKYAALNPLSRLGSSLSHEELQRLAKAIKDMRLPVTGSTGFANAQVTAGGIYTHEVDPQTMASRIVSDLYLCGEILDIDGICGGYNLQWAWSSGHLAGCLL